MEYLIKSTHVRNTYSIRIIGIYVNQNGAYFDKMDDSPVLIRIEKHINYSITYTDRET